MSRVMKTTQPALIAGSTFVTLFTVPASHKYELVGVTLTTAAGVAANVAIQHTFASTAAIISANKQVTVAEGGTLHLDCFSEVFEAGDSLQIVWAPGAGNGQAMCWYVDVVPA